MRTCFFNVDSGKVIPYDSNKHLKLAYKFFGWKECDDWVILVGPYRQDIWLHNELLEKVVKIGDESIPMKKPDAAGDITRSKIVRWSSAGLKIETPNEVRRIIANALGANFEE